MSGQRSSSKRPSWFEDRVSVEGIILEYVIDSGWEDYDRFSRRLTERIFKKQPSTKEDLANLVRGFAHPFFSFNKVSRERFVSRFPSTQLLLQAAIPRKSTVRTKRKGATNRRNISKRIRFLILERDGFRCRLCGKTAKDTRLEVNHMAPIAKGGTNSLANLWILCFDCNGGKSNLSIHPSADVSPKEA